MDVCLSSDYCIYEYMYRDAGNWKTYGEVLLGGRCSAAAIHEIQKILGSDAVFVAEQVGLPPLQRQHLLIYNAIEDEDLDHAFHEFLSLRPAKSADISTQPVCGSLHEVLEAMRGIQGRWNVSLSPFA